VDPTRPPPDVRPERLFRLLLGRPRPTLPIAFRFPWAPEVAFSVRGLTALEDAMAGDVPAEGPDELWHSEVVRRLLAFWVLADGAPAFQDADAVGALEELEIAALWRATRPATAIISPQYRTANTDAWQDALDAGARHPSNRALAGLIHYSSELAIGFGATTRVSAPDRYFGLPYADLTDGQIIAYQAAKKIFDKPT